MIGVSLHLGGRCVGHVLCGTISKTMMLGLLIPHRLLAFMLLELLLTGMLGHWLGATNTSIRGWLLACTCCIYDGLLDFLKLFCLQKDVLYAGESLKTLTAWPHACVPCAHLALVCCL